MRRHSESEREAIVAGLDDRARAVYDYLARSVAWLGEAQIAQGLKAAPDQIKPVLRALADKGLLDAAPPSKRRPFGTLYRPSPLRIPVVGDWLAGGAADRGYADLAAIQRDYASVKTLADPADGAEAAKAEADRIAALAKAKAEQDAELAAQAAEKEAARAARAEDKKAAAPAADAPDAPDGEVAS